MNSLDKKNEVETNFNLMKLLVKFSSVLKLWLRDKERQKTAFDTVWVEQEWIYGSADLIEIGDML